MEQDLKNIRNLLTSGDPANVKLALQLIKGNKELKVKTENYFQPILEASKKKTLSAIPKIVSELIEGKGTPKARLEIGTIPEIHDSIEVLYLKNHHLEEVPEWIKNLSNLKELALCTCNLKKLPKWIGEFSKLEMLSIADNSIKKLPETFGNLQQLINCSIVENEIEELPKSIVNLKKLRCIYLVEGNPITKAEIVEIKKLLPNIKIR